MTTLYLLNQDDELMDTLTEETGLISAQMHEQINSVTATPFVFRFSNDINSGIKGIGEENFVVFRDKDRRMRLFIMKEIDEEHTPNGAETVVTCFPAYTEIADRIIEFKRIINGTANDALYEALRFTRWDGQVIGVSGTNTVRFHYRNSLDAVWDIIETWGGEVVDEVVFNGSTIVQRKLTITKSMGNLSGAWFEVGHNLDSIRRTVISNPVTALYGRGANIPIENEWISGYTQYLDFQNVEWSVANGDPVDKPLGQRYVEDPEAFALYGRIHEGQKLHKQSVWHAQDIEDEEDLLRKTWEHLQQIKYPEVNYEVSAINSEVGDLSLGDSVLVSDNVFNPPVKINSRVVGIRYDLCDLERSLEYEIGQILSFKRYNKIDQIIENVENNQGRWEAPILEGNFPDIIPSVPANFTVTGGFKTIFLKWDFVGDLSVKHYELFASQTLGFDPNMAEMIYQGATNAFNHEVGTGETWYYRVRAVNHKGRVSDFTMEFSASTVKIITDDMLFGSVNANILADLSVSAEKLADQAVTEFKLGNGAVTATKIANLAVGNAAIQNGAITNAKIGTAAVDTAQIRDAAITDAKIAELTADKITAGTLSSINIEGVNIDGSFITGGTITSDTNINVTTDLRVGNNVYLGDALDYTTSKILRFNNQSTISSEGSTIDVNTQNGLNVGGGLYVGFIGSAFSRVGINLETDFYKQVNFTGFRPTYNGVEVSLVNHNHDSQYAPISHNHDGSYIGLGTDGAGLSLGWSTSTGRLVVYRNNVYVGTVAVSV